MPLILLILCILVPGVYTYFSGRRFLKMEHDDEFAQQYFKYQQRSGIAYWLSMAVLIVLVTLFPARTRFLEYVNDYTLGLGTLMVFFFSYIIHLAGFTMIDQEVRENRVSLLLRIRLSLTMLVLLAWPYVFICLLCFGSRSHYLYVAVFSVGAFGLFYFMTAGIWSALLGALPVDPGPFKSKISEITRAENMSDVKIRRFSASGVKIANAFMVGHWGTEKAVFISEYAYQNLTPAELECIYLHEIGHIQKNQLLSRSVALTIPVVVIPVIQLFAGNPGFLVQAGMFIGALALIRLFVPSQRFEREADEFAARYCSRSRDLIAGLEKIYGLGLLPKRFSITDESRMTHPSLVNRIRHIRRLSHENLPVLEERKEFKCRGKAVRITFSAATFSVFYSDSATVTRTYSDVMAMFPSPGKNGCLLTVKYREKGKVEKFQMDAPVEEMNAVLGIIEYSFAETPSIDPGRFQRAFTVQSILMIILGSAMLFLGAPATLIIGLTGLFNRTRKMLLSYAVSSAVIATGMMYLPLQKYIDARPLVFVFGAFCLLALYDYVRFARLEEKTEGRGRISLTSSIISGSLAIAVLFPIVVFDLSYITAAVYSVIFVNLCALSIGLGLAFDPGRPTRLALTCANVLMLLVFALIRRI